MSSDPGPIEAFEAALDSWGNGEGAAEVERTGRDLLLALRSLSPGLDARHHRTQAEAHLAALDRGLPEAEPEQHAYWLARAGMAQAHALLAGLG